MQRTIFSGGDGLTQVDPVIIHADNTMMGILAEYKYMAQKHGEPGKDFLLKSQYLLQTETGYMDKMVIQLSDGSEATYFFDITDFYGKM